VITAAQCGIDSISRLMQADEILLCSFFNDLNNALFECVFELDDLVLPTSV